MIGYLAQEIFKSGPTAAECGLKEAIESDNIPTVSKKFNIPEGTIYDWVRKARNSPTKVINSKDQEIKKLKKQLEDEKIKNEIMRELLKKSYQVLG